MRNHRFARALAPLVALIISLAGTPAGAAAITPNTFSGYIPVDDGAKLHYAVTLPAPTGRFPVAIVYSPYADGTDPVALGNDPLTSQDLLTAGYAVLGVSIRGTGCSSGIFDALEPREALDGAEVVEWAAVQNWSDGRVGMFGLSFPGISQFGAAGLRPPHLRAIAPFQFVTDLYRDVAYMGGIFNSSFGPLWALGFQPAYSNAAAVAATALGDSDCASHVADRQSGNLAANALLLVLAHPFDDSALVARDPKPWIPSIDVPALACLAWQDDMVESRGLEGIDGLDPEKTWFIGTNGYYGICDDPQLGSRLVRFFDRFVKGDANGFEATPHVTLLHETHVDRGGKLLPLNGWVLPGTVPTAFSAPGWTTTHASWPVAVQPVTMHLRSGARLASDAAVAPEPADSYLYPVSASGTEDGGFQGNLNLEWKVPTVAGGSLTYTTPAIEHDAEFFGPGSADLWLASTATDADLQVSLSEVRPDGQEVYVQRGWLRASHRRLDPDRSTTLRPYQTHQAADQEPLTPGEPTPLRIELFPFDYVFRAGSHIRLTIDAPTANTGLDGFDYLKTPAANTILHDPDHNSQLVLGLIPGGNAEEPYPACDTIINQPCRANLAPVPPGTIDLR